MNSFGVGSARLLLTIIWFSCNICRDTTYRKTRYRDRIEGERAIIEIVSLYGQGEISAKAARKKLYPYVERKIEYTRQNNIDVQIQTIKAHLERLELIKRNPKRAIKNEIDVLLGEIDRAGKGRM